MGTWTWIGPDRKYVYSYNTTAEFGGALRKATSKDKYGSPSGFYDVKIGSREGAIISNPGPASVWAVEKYSKPKKGFLGGEHPGDEVRALESQVEFASGKKIKLSTPEVKKYIERTTAKPSPEWDEDYEENFFSKTISPQKFLKKAVQKELKRFASIPASRPMISGRGKIFRRRAHMRRLQ